MKKLQLTDLLTLTPKTRFLGIIFERNYGGAIIGRQTADTWEIVQILTEEELKLELQRKYGLEEGIEVYKEMDERERIASRILIKAIYVAFYDIAFENNIEDLSYFSYEEYRLI